MDVQKLCDTLTDRYPQWADTIRLLSFQEAAGVHPADNDGRTIYSFIIGKNPSKKIPKYNNIV